MSEVETQETEVETNPIADFISSVENEKYTDAEQQFNDMIGDRLQDTLDQAKIRIAQSIYGEEEVDDAIDEVESGDIEDDEEV